MLTNGGTASAAEVFAAALQENGRATIVGTKYAHYYVYRIVLHYTTLRYTTLFFTPLHCSAVHCTALHCTESHCTDLTQIINIVTVFIRLLSFCQNEFEFSPRQNTIKARTFGIVVLKLSLCFHVNSRLINHQYFPGIGC